MKLISVHLGNGLSIGRSLQPSIIAHIDSNRNTSIREKVTIEELEEILELAKYDDRTVSATQEDKVFDVPPRTKDFDIEPIDDNLPYRTFVALKDYTLLVVIDYGIDTINVYSVPEDKISEDGLVTTELTEEYMRDVLKHKPSECNYMTSDSLTINYQHIN